MKQAQRHYDHKAVEAKWPHSVPRGGTSRGKPFGKAQGKQLVYDHHEVEQKWQKLWEDVKINQLDLARVKKPRKASPRGKPFGSAQGKPFYNLMMFPYPSAEGLHIGNMYAFTGSDIYGRFKRMQGYSVFEPIGLDGFGIHSENYALKIGKHPMEQAKISEKNFYRQLRQIGAMFDWTRTLVTYDPDYYRWTQWIFVQMFKHGLAYRARASVNWCPSCKTVLADEQVINGACERCGNIVEKRLLEQWFFRITAYAEKLLENLASLDWSEKVKIAQENWIGKKEGINITYPVINEKGSPLTMNHEPLTLTCFTTRPDTNFGATFVVLSPEHPFVAKLLKIKNQKSKIKNEEMRKYMDEVKKKSKEGRMVEGRKKTGVFTGLYCINQLNNYKMPLYISDFVVMDVGTGAVVGVPGHDRRDFEFAQVFKLPVVRVVKGKDGDTSLVAKISQVQEEEGEMINSKFLNGLDIHEATIKMMDYLEEKGWGKRLTTYHLRDWLISRQRYWGPPIPMIYCEKCAKAGKSWFTLQKTQKTQKIGISENRDIRKSDLPTLRPSEFSEYSERMYGWYPVPEDQLPVKLPFIKDYKPGDDGIAPLAKHKEFYETKCPGCGEKAVRETDVSDTFLDSSWYFLRYPSVRGSENSENSDNQNIRVSDKSDKSDSPTLRHSEYSEYSDSLPWDPEITKKWLPVTMYTGGAEHSVLHLMYSRFVTMALHDWGYLDFSAQGGEPFTRFYAHGLVIKDGAKMSKSKGNVVNPDEYIVSYGADAVRLYLMFMGPFDQGGDFRDSAMEGMYRWINRLWRIATGSISKIKDQKSKSEESTEVKRALHRLVKKVTEDTEKRRYNTAIAAMMEFTNLVASQGLTLRGEDLKTFVLLLAPFAPHLAEELWQRLKKVSENSEDSDSQKTRPSEIQKKSDFQKLWGSDESDTQSFLGIPNWSVHQQPWPQFDLTVLVEEVIEIIVQVNGKLRDTIKSSKLKAQSSKEVEKLARESEKVKKYLAGQKVKKVIFVPAKLINFVV